MKKPNEVKPQYTAQEALMIIEELLALDRSSEPACVAGLDRDGRFDNFERVGAALTFQPQHAVI